ncbi:hypothetical protein EB118_20510 [bacterium]|nr:hypothetical protein [bacterium]
MAENFIRVKQINQTDLSGFVAQVVQDTGVLANGFVTTTTNQNISGIKTFLNNLNVSGDLTVAGTIKYNEIIDITTTGNISGYTGYFQELYANNLVYNTGNQTISGIKTFNSTGIFLDDVNITGGSSKKLTINTNFELQIDDLQLSGTDVTLTEGNIYATNLVYNTGDQTISGIKTFNSGIVLARAQVNTPTGLEDSKGLQWLGLGGTNYDQTIYAAYDGFQKIGINFRSSPSPTNLQDTIIFRPSKIEAFRPIEVSGNLKVDGHVNVSGFMFNEAHYSRNPLGFYSDAGIKTGRINILTGIAPFSRLVYSGNLGVLNNPNETMVLFSTTGFAPRPLLPRVIASRNLAIANQSSTVALGTHTEFMFNSSTTITNNCGIDFSPFGGSFAIGGGSIGNRYGAFSLIDPTKFSNDFLYVTKDYTQAYNTKAFGGNFGEYIVSGNTFVNISLATATYKTGITYAQNAAQYLTGFLVGFYSAQGTNINCNPFNACGAAGIGGTSTGCHIVFESAWLTTDAQNNSWLNMAFRNHGPSGMRFATSQGFPNGANPTGIVLDMFAFDY